MKTIKQIYVRKKECKHSMVFEPIGVTEQNPAIASSVYVSKLVLPQNTNRVELTIGFPDASEVKS